MLNLHETEIDLCPYNFIRCTFSNFELKIPSLQPSADIFTDYCGILPNIEEQYGRIFAVDFI